MRIDRIHIKGFRNFDDTEIILQKKTLIIGANDVGKTNLLYALRLLFDKTISEHDLELSDSDYNAYSKTDTVEITVTICDVTEECLLSAFAGSVKDGRIVIRYVNKKNDSYKFLAGYDTTTLTELPTRQYIKRLNMQYVDTNRNLFSFLNHERVKMLQTAKDRLSDSDKISDDILIGEIQGSLDSINSSINSLKYISASLEQVNKELSDLSIHNEDQTVRFIAGESNADKLLDNLILAYSSGDNPLSIGGDGRNNQIFLATWIAKQHLLDSIDHVTFYAIEEPEAHLHPHQQRKLSSYIQDNFSSQVLVTTHSPHIASRFDPSSIVRLYTENKFSFAACGGCSEMLKNVFDDFGYRLNALSAETFFSDGVFLVEGTSEVLIYTALAKELGLDTDRYNVSILSVEGIGFKPYIAIFDALNIPWTLRTDNDIYSKPQTSPTKEYFAGISRIMGIIEGVGDGNSGLIDYWEKHSSLNEWPRGSDIPTEAQELQEFIRDKAESLNIFLSDVDLENDLAKSEVSSDLIGFYHKQDYKALVETMQKKKAENMLNFLSAHHDKLIKLKDNKFTLPLTRIITTIMEKARPNDAKGTD